MSKQNSSLISHRISTPLGKVQAAHLDALLLGIQLARGRAPDEVFNLLANELRSAIILYPMANGMRNSSEYSVSLSGLVLIVSGIIAMFSGELRMGGWGLLVVASWFGWWLLIGIGVVVAASLDRRG